MDRAEDLRVAMEAAERALGGVVERYRLALGCCACCGDRFELGDIAIAGTDNKGRIQFEHEACPDGAVNLRDSYRNPQQNGSLRPSSV
jgi:hypothetical protein